MRRNLSRIKNFLSLLETVFNSKRLRTILGALIFFVGVFGYLFYISEPDINSYGDGIWLALVTITTVGYGDIEVMTTLGRFVCLLYTSPSPRDVEESRMPSSA